MIPCGLPQDYSLLSYLEWQQRTFRGFCRWSRIKALKGGVKKAREIYKTKIDKEYNIIISIPSYPKSIDFYQATRLWDNIVFRPRSIVKKITIIITASCEKGFTQSSFYK